MKKALILSLLIFILFVGGFVWFFFSKEPLKQTTSNASLSLTAKRILNQLPTWEPMATWGQITLSEQELPSQTIKGVSRVGSITTQTASVPHFENEEMLHNLGFYLDNTLAADGPGSSQWAYEKTSDGKTQLVLFSTKTLPTSSNPNEPLQFNCPCQTAIKVFVSDPF